MTAAARVAVTGASGNIGTAVVRELSARGHEVVAIARRAPAVPPGGSVEWREADVRSSDLSPVLADVDAVVHLAWMFQPTHRPQVTWEANAAGTRRVLDAVARAGVRTVVTTSSVAAYSPADHDEPVDETWPTDGTSTAAYCREKAYVERSLDAFEAGHRGVRVVRLRPAFVFQRSAGSEQRRIFAGALVRPTMLDRRLLPVVPVPADLRMQAVHAGDVARAVAAAVERDVGGAFNLAAPDVLRRREIGRVMDARTVEVPQRLTRSVVALAWRTHAVRAPGDLLEALLRIPLMSSERARRELDWEPAHSGLEALAQMIDGARHDWGSRTPPLDPR